MKKTLTIVVLVLAVLFSMIACAAPASAPEVTSEAKVQASDAAAKETAQASTTDEKITIGFNAGAMTNEMMQTVVESTKYWADKKGVDFIMTESNFDAEQIIPNVNTLLMQGADVVIDFNVNGEVGGNIVDVVKEAGAAGTIGVDVEYFSPNGKDRAWFMGANNQQAGELCGEAIGDYVIANKDGKLDELVLIFNSENGDEVKKRMGGAIDGLKKKGIELKEDQIEWIDLGGGGADTTVQGQDKFMGWLSANPDAKSVGVVAVNCETMLGVQAAAEMSGRIEDCIMASNNVSSQFTENALNGGSKQWIGSVAYFPEKYGEYLVDLAIDIASGKNTDPNTNVTIEHEFVLYDNVAQYLKDLEEYNKMIAGK